MGNCCTSSQEALKFGLILLYTLQAFDKPKHKCFLVNSHVSIFHDGFSGSMFYEFTALYKFRHSSSRVLFHLHSLYLPHLTLTVKTLRRHEAVHEAPNFATLFSPLKGLLQIVSLPVKKCTRFMSGMVL